MPTVLEILIKHLKNWNVSHIFGVPGRPVVPLITEINKQNLTFVLTRHETGAGYAASGFALQRNTLGVAFATSGPGGINLLTSAGQAMAHNLPVLFLTGQVSAANIGKSYSQDSSQFGSNLVKMFEPVTKYSGRVERGDSFQSHLQHAVEKAFSGVKGPVHLSIPLDVLVEEIPSFEISFPSIPATKASNIDDVFQLITAAKNPVFILGKGIRSANSYEEIYELATRWNVPVITTGGGKGTFPTNHPLSLGSYGLGGSEQADLFLQSGVDVMIVIGSSLTDMSLSGFNSSFYPENVIHFDYDPTFVGKSIPRPTTYVPGDIKENLIALLEMTMKSNRPVNLGRPIPILQAAAAIDYEEDKQSTPYISSVTAIKVIRKNLPDHTKVFADVGSHAYYAVKHFDVYQPNTFFFDDRFIAMGNGIGYAIGASIASEDINTPIACITGDGCMQMHGTEIATAVDHRASVLFFVFNNSGLDMVETGMKHWQQCPGHAIYQNTVDFVSFAKSFSCNGYRCMNESDIQLAIERGLTNKGPTIIEIMVDPEEVPPTLKRDA
ncbi:thiamine pyrophosphate-binding protein [Bacillus sp. Marseille-P3661]|uniref:thiamine pyrophosphate-binding protein n=1 Tax=Bacillus sp. Marseille-P3661 TaxID=1936234 RepID=UPI000C856E84|nr:thiamine pyrophosphate-binding protein [Bacillus sp. Marseille-P3661]